MLLLAMACTLTSQEVSVRVMAASSLGPALTPILSQWSEQTHHPHSLSTAGTPRLVAQLQAGAPADLVLTADRAWMEVLRSEGRVAEPVHLLSNALVLVVPAQSAVQSVEQLQAPIALAGAQVPAGRYGEEALKEEGLWPGLSPGARRGDNVRTVVAWVSRGEVNGAVVYASDAVGNEALRVVHRFQEHTPVQIWAAPVAQGQDRGLLEYLGQDAAQQAFTDAGFARP